MPIYEYVCDDCDHHFEKIQKISDEPISVCPKCSSSRCQRLVSAPRFKLKGTGWYETDFKDNKKPSGESSASDTGASDKNSNSTSSKKDGDKSSSDPKPTTDSAG